MGFPQMPDPVLPVAPVVITLPPIDSRIAASARRLRRAGIEARRAAAAWRRLTETLDAVLDRHTGGAQRKEQHP